MHNESLAYTLHRPHSNNNQKKKDEEEEEEKGRIKRRHTRHIKYMLVLLDTITRYESSTQLINGHSPIDR